MLGNRFMLTRFGKLSAAALRFTASSSTYAMVGSVGLATSYTYEAWVRVPAATGAGGLASHQSGTDFGWGIGISRGTPGWAATVRMGDGLGTMAAVISAQSGSWTYDEWHHLAFVYENGAGAGNVRVYRDGSLWTSATFNAPAPGGRSANFFLGGYDLTAGYGNVDVDEVRYWNVARTQAQIQGSMGGIVDPTQVSGLVTYHRFENTAASSQQGGTAATLSGSPSYITDTAI